MLAHAPLLKLLSSYLMPALCVVEHVLGMVGLSRILGTKGLATERSLVVKNWLLVRLAWGIVLLHLLEIGVWAIFFLQQGCMPDLRTAFYFSSMTYTTVGYGDVVLLPEWWGMAGATSLTGILMAGLSTAFFFAYLVPLLGQRGQRA